MNDRYLEEHRGKTRKSAASAKPKSAAASSVYVKSKTKTKAEKKAVRRAERQKQAELERKYANPPTPEYRRLRRIWWVLLILAIVCLLVSFLVGRNLGDGVSMVILVASYVFIIGALWLEFSKMKKLRRAYQEEMEAKKTKARRAEERREKAAAKAAKQEAAEKYEEAKEAEAQKKGKGILGGLFGGKKKADAEPESTDGAAASGAVSADSASAKDEGEPGASRK